MFRRRTQDPLLDETTSTWCISDHFYCLLDVVHHFWQSHVLTHVSQTRWDCESLGRDHFRSYRSLLSRIDPLARCELEPNLAVSCQGLSSTGTRPSGNDESHDSSHRSRNRDVLLSCGMVMQPCLAKPGRSSLVTTANYALHLAHMASRSKFADGEVHSTVRHGLVGEALAFQPPHTLPLCVVEVTADRHRICLAGFRAATHDHKLHYIAIEM